jgi:hypothetical protein
MSDPYYDGDSPAELRSITPQGGEAVALSFGRTRGFKPRVRYILILMSLQFPGFVSHSNIIDVS